MTIDRRGGRPLHVGVLVGLSAATYAATLAAVANLQSASERALIADRRPSVDAVEALTVVNDANEGRLDAARLSYERLAATYPTLVEDLTALQGRIDRLSAEVARVGEVSAALPERAPLPRPAAAARPATRPPSHATTGASGAP